MVRKILVDKLRDDVHPNQQDTWYLVWPGRQVVKATMPITLCLMGASQNGSDGEEGTLLALSQLFELVQVKGLATVSSSNLATPNTTPGTTQLQLCGASDAACKLWLIVHRK